MSDEDRELWERFLSRPDYYDPDGNPIGPEEFAELHMNRRLDDDSWWRRSTLIEDKSGLAHEPIQVSTVWLGTDYAIPFTGEEEPLFWETMIFGGLYHESGWRYSSREAAFAHHEWVVTAIKDGIDPWAELPTKLKEE